MKKSIAFIGAGNMGGAMASRVLDAKNRTVVVFDPDSAKCAAFAEKGAQIAESAAAACEAADYILLAVKPQIIAKVLDGLRAIDFTGKTILGALANHVSVPNANFQPMNANYGILESLPFRVKGKRNRYEKMSERAIEVLTEVIKQNEL